MRTVMPAPLRYPGMAADRWWQFEDARVNLNRIEGDADDLLRLALVDFSLLYANDWFVVPVDLAPGGVFFLDSVARRHRRVRRAHVRPALQPLGTARSRVADVRRQPVSTTCSSCRRCSPTASTATPWRRSCCCATRWRTWCGRVERLAPSAPGGGFDRDAAYRLRAGPGAAAARPATGRAALPPRDDRARQLDPVPAGRASTRPSPRCKLQRAAALLDEDGAPGFSRPLGRILEPDARDFSLFEEEVPRAGARVTRAYQYARWVDGSTVLWLGRRKGAGRGEGSSGLRFDRIEDA